MLFNQLKTGDNVYIVEIIGTFKKSTEYCVGNVVSVSKSYDEPLPQGLFPMPNQLRRKLVDITVECGGESKKFAVAEDKSCITDNSIGLTIATNKLEIANMIKNQYNMYKNKKEQLLKCDLEMAKCDSLLKEIGIEESDEDNKIERLQNEIKELKDIIKQAGNMVPPLMKQMLPQNMQNAIKEAS